MNSQGKKQLGFSNNFWSLFRLIEINMRDRSIQSLASSKLLKYNSQNL